MAADIQVVITVGCLPPWSLVRKPGEDRWYRVHRKLVVLEPLQDSNDNGLVVSEETEIRARDGHVFLVTENVGDAQVHSCKTGTEVIWKTDLVQLQKHYGGQNGSEKT